MMTHYNEHDDFTQCRFSGHNYIWQHVIQSVNPQAGMTIILGDNGSGKSFWYHKLQQAYPAHHAIACHRNTHLMNILKQFAHFFHTPVMMGPHTVEEHAQKILDTLDVKADHYLIIDDAHWLSDEALSLLVFLTQHMALHSLRIILLGNTSLTQRLKRVNTANCYMHEIVLRPMSLKECELFIYETYQTSQDIDPVMIKRIHQATGGFPGETMKLIKDYWGELFVKKKNIDLAQVLEEHNQQYLLGNTHTVQTPVIQWSVRRVSIIVLMICVVVLFLRKYTIYSFAETPQHISDTEIDVAAMPAYDQESHTALSDATQDTDVSNPLSYDTIIAPMSSQDEARMDLPENEKPQNEEPQVASAEISSSASEDTQYNVSSSDAKDMPVVAQNIITTEKHAESIEQRMIASPDGYMVQLGIDEKNNKKSLIKIQQKIEALYVSEIIAVHTNNKEYLILVSGPFTSLDEAKAMIKSLPEDVQKHKPWVRRVRFIMQEMHSAD